MSAKMARKDPELNWPRSSVRSLRRALPARLALGPRSRPALGILLLLLGLLVPLLPLGSYALQISSQAVVFATLSVAWSLLRRAGAISFGHAAYFGTGAYASALLALNLGWSPWLGTLVGAFAAASVALIVGWICVPLRGPYFALGTLASAEIMRALVLNGGGLTGGSLGLVFIPAFAHGRAEEFWAAWTWLCLAIAVSWFMAHGRAGLALSATRQNMVAAEALGLPAQRVRLLALIVSGFIAGLAGGSYAHFVGYLDANLVFGLLFSAAPMVMAMFGGSLTIAGPVLGGLILYLVDALYFSRFTPTTHGALYGIVIISLILARPAGLLGRK
ncbi:MAG: branched-chain amino acid ABC transporter permease [Rudaea sp.]